MAAKKDEAKIKFTAETTKMNQDIKKADSTLTELRSELRLNAEIMKATGETAEGLAKRHQILEKESKQYETKLEALNQKLESASDIFGENSIEAQKLRTTINNTSSAYEKVKQDIAAVEDALEAQKSSMNGVQSETTETRSAFERLTDTIEAQRAKMDDLEQAYKDAVLMYGKNSSEAKELKAEMQDLNSQLSDNETGLEKLNKMAKKASGSMDDLEDSTKDAGDGFTVAKGAMATFAGNAMTGLIGALKDGAQSIYNLADETREYRNEMAKLSSAAEDSGYSADFAKEKYMDMYAVLADETAANTTISNFMAMEMSQQDLNTVLNAATGIWGKYGDSIPLDGLAESINETANAGTVTGNLADALNWAGISEDDFNEKLKKCKSTQGRQKVIVEQLDKTYGKLGETYKENNKSVMDANRATAEQTDVMAQLGEKIEPVTTAVKRGFTEVVEAAMGLVDADVDAAAEKIGDAFGWVAENIETIVDVAKVGATAIAGIFVVNKASQFISSIRTVTSTMGLFRTATAGAAVATEAQTMAQTGLNVAMSANPIGAVIMGITALTAAIGGIVGLEKKRKEEMQAQIDETYGLTDAQQELVDSIHEEHDAYLESKAAREEAMSGIQQEYAHYDALAQELKGITDENGKIKKGYEDRAAVIAGILSDALGIEISITDGIVKN